MSYPTPIIAPLRWVGSILKVCFLYLWIGKAIYLAIGTAKYRSYEFLAICYLALRDGLLTMPETLKGVLGAIFSFILIVNNELTHQLGYAPFSLTGVEIVADELFNFVLLCVAVLSAVQFIIWTVLKWRGVTILWRAPCVPDIFQGKMKLLYWIVCWVVSVLLCLYSYRYGVVTLFATGISLVLTMRLPVLAGTPFWLLDITKTKRSGSFWGRFKTSWSKARTHSEHNYQDNNEAEHEEQADNNYSGQSSGPVINKVAEAHATFDLPPEIITHEKLRKKYRTLMKKIHPDQEGSSRLAAIMNADYDCLLAHYRWKR